MKISPLFFVRFLRWIWPLLRLCSGVSKRCTSCLLSEKYIDLIHGICPECQQKQLKRDMPLSENDSSEFIRNQNLFDERINYYTQLNKDRSYHIAILFSGGKDSTYILDRLKTEYPNLKILLIMVHNGFTNPLAFENAKKVSNDLGVDLLTVNHHVPLFFKKFKEAFLNLKGRGSYGEIDKVDGDTIFKIGKDIARDLKIPALIAGLTAVQIKLIFKRTEFEIEKDGVHMLYPLAVWGVGENVIREYVRDKKLLVPGSEDPVASNNQLIVTMCAIDVLNLGYCSFEPEFAELVRQGKADRKTWLYNFEILEFGVKTRALFPEIKSVLAQLGLTPEQVIRK